MKKVFATSDPVALGMVREMLENDGIESAVFNDGMPWGAIELLSSTPQLWVLRDEDEKRARAIVERYKSGAVRNSLAREPWQCPACGEMIEGQFSECWKCTTIDPRREAGARCEQCGYLLRGLPERRCPECGTPFGDEVRD